MRAAVNRRGALNFIGLGSVTLLAACTGNNKDSSSSSEADKNSDNAPERTDFAGEVKLETYDTSAGTFEPATRENPAKNAPKPIQPDNASEDSIAGLYASIAYLVASMQYALLSGDVEPLDKTALVAGERLELTGSNSILRQIGKVYWSETSKFSIFLKTDKPTQEGSEYTWPAQLVHDIGSYRVTVKKENGEEKKNVEEIPQGEQKLTSEGSIKAKYDNGKWNISGIKENSEKMTSDAQKKEAN